MKLAIKKSEIEDKKNGPLSSLLFLVSPVIAVFLAFRNYQASWAKNIIWFFVVFYGYTMVISNNQMDAASYQGKLLFKFSNPDSFGTLLNSFYNFNSQQVDVVDQLITHFVASFTASQHVLFAVYGLIFGFFYSRNIWYLLGRAGSKLSTQGIVFIIVFAFIVGFWNINGFRFWTAAHVFFFGAFPYIFERKSKFLWVALASALFHFAFIVPIAVFLLYILLRNRLHLFFAFFIITFFVNNINLESLRAIMENVLPDLLFNKTRGYTNEEYATRIFEEKGNYNLYARLYDDLLKWVVAAFFVYIYSSDRKRLIESPELFNLFCFSMLYLGFANLLSLIPSGGRYMVIGNLFAIATVFFYLQCFEMEKGAKRIFYLSAPLILLYLVVSLRLGADTIGVTTVFGNPVVMFFVNQDWAIVELLKP